MSVLILVLASIGFAADPPPVAPEPEPEEEAIVFGVLGTLSGNGGLGVAGIGIGERPQGRKVGGGEVDVDHDTDTDVLTVVNDQPYAITFSMDLTKAGNVQVDPAVPLERVMAPGERLEVRFTRENRKKDISYSFRWGWKMGTNQASHAPDAIYVLPWPDDRSFECTQSYNGKYSHDDEHALDIVMPKGTPILAARAGRVVEVTDGWGDGGPDRAYLDEANSVRVQHADGTVASYVHLEAGGMEVAVGDEVVAGQPLGRSGHSGFSRVPHLHFVVKSPLDGWTYRTWPARFQVGDELLMLGPDKWYPRAPPK